MELQGSGRSVKFSSGINMTININVCHQFACITKYLVSASMYVDLPDVNQWLTTCGLVYKTDIEKFIKCYMDADFSSGWAPEDDNNAVNVIFHTGCVITYVVCPVLWCIKIQT